MNIQLHNVISDITGVTGMKIIRSIVQGERSSRILASYRDRGCKNPIEVIEQSLEGHYREEHIFTLTQALELYDLYQEKLISCDKQIEKQLELFENRASPARLEEKRPRSRSKCKNKPSFDVTTHLIRITGVDLTKIPGIEASSALKIISEIGLDLSRWNNGKQFASWLGLCPGNKVSGGKRLGSKSKRTSNYAASTLRMAASTLYKSQTALGAFFRRLKSRLGAPKATTAAAHKLALIIYNMLKHGREYNEIGQDYYEQQYHDRIIRNLTKRANSLGFVLVENHLNSIDS
jgi:transposase